MINNKQAAPSIIIEFIIIISQNNSIFIIVGVLTNLWCYWLGLDNFDALVMIFFNLGLINLQKKIVFDYAWPSLTLKLMMN
jgi:hypothetical protein